MAQSDLSYVITDEIGPFITISDIGGRIGREGDPGLTPGREFTPQLLAPFLGSIGGGIYGAIVVENISSVDAFETSGYRVFCLDENDGLLDPRTGFAIGSLPPTNGDDLFDLELYPQGDELRALGGDDFVRGSAVADVVFGGIGDDTILGLAGNDRLSGGADNDVLRGDDGDDILDGGTGDDALQGGAGSDQLRGSDGDDTLSGGQGRDLLNGGVGNDTADYSLAGAVSIALGLSRFQGTGGDGRDRLIGIENVVGSGYDDVLRGNAEANMLSGGTGNDTILGLGGADNLIGGHGNDVIEGGGGDDLIEGSEGNDRLIGNSGSDRLVDDGFAFSNDYLSGGGGRDYLDGGSGDDVLRGGAGRDVLDGGQGFEDFADYSGNTAVSVDLSITGFQRINGHGADRLVNIDGLIGSSMNDRLFGHDNPNLASILRGGNGGDLLVARSSVNHLYGERGDDLIRVRFDTDSPSIPFALIDGGSGRDVIDIDLGREGRPPSTQIEAAGGSGADSFVIRGQTADVLITDFQHGVDRITITDAVSNFDELIIVQSASTIGWVIRSEDRNLLIRITDPGWTISWTADDFEFG